MNREVFVSAKINDQTYSTTFVVSPLSFLDKTEKEVALLAVKSLVEKIESELLKGE